MQIAQRTAPTPTEAVRAQLAERIALGTFPLIGQQPTLDNAFEKAAPRRFTGEPLTGFGALS